VSQGGTRAPGHVAGRVVVRCAKARVHLPDVEGSSPLAPARLVDACNPLWPNDKRDCVGQRDVVRGCESGISTPKLAPHLYTYS
jgi:hypothetical protein